MLTQWQDAFSLYLLLAILHSVVAVACFFLSRAQEKRTGNTEYAGKATVLFTLGNVAFIVLYLSATMILATVIQAGDGPGGWKPVRLGLALGVPALVMLGASGALWKLWTDATEMLPRGNLVLKCYTGLNTLGAGILLALLATQILFFLLELIADAQSWGSGGNLFKELLVSFASTSLFLVLNIYLFGRSGDQVIPGTFAPLHARISVEQELSPETRSLPSNPEETPPPPPPAFPEGPPPPPPPP